MSQSKKKNNGMEELTMMTQKDMFLSENNKA